jgi:hypothetical protein
MEKIHVIVVPEKDEYADELYNEDIVYINPDLGSPNLDGWNAKYLAPFWLESAKQSVTRLFHILDYDPLKNIITVGNSFVLKKAWNNMGQNRRFAYYPLEDFNFVEVKDGLLIPYDFS